MQRKAIRKKKKEPSAKPLDSAVELANAQKRLDDVKTRRIDLIERRSKLEGRIQSVQQDVGRKYLAGDHTGIRQTAEMRAEIEAIAAAIKALDEDERQLGVDVERAKACDLRQRAAQKVAELETLDAQTAILLAQLSTLEGVEFSRSILSSQPLPGAWLTPLLKPPLEYQGVLELGVNIPRKEAIVAVPRSRRLRMEIEEIELEALIIEQRVAA